MGKTRWLLLVAALWLVAAIPSWTRPAWVLLNVCRDFDAVEVIGDFFDAHQR